MRMRVKFTKTGPVKWIGHLDVMRYFQKALRRAEIPAAFSGGFSPHMLMSFAAPLGVGITSDAEYFDIDLAQEISSAEMVSRLNAQMTEGVRVLSAVRIGEDKNAKGMSLVAAAAYEVRFRASRPFLPENWEISFASFMEQPEIRVMRKTKRSEAETDIRPWIYGWETAPDRISLLLSAGSVHNLKPELVVQAFAAGLGIEVPGDALMIHRKEIYAEICENGNVIRVPLDALGETVA